MRWNYQLAILVAVGALLLVLAACRPEEPLPQLWPMPTFTLTDQQGRPFRTAELAGRAAIALDNARLYREARAASRSFTVKVTGPCPPGVYSGMFGRLMIPVEDEELTVVPAAAVRRVGQLTLVDVLHDGHLQRRSVQVGRRIDSDFEVLSGLREGERVVLHEAQVPQEPAP